MLLINSLLVGGALIASAKLYQKNKRKMAKHPFGKKTRWTVYAQKAGADEGSIAVRKHKKKNHETAIDKMRATLQTLKQDTLASVRTCRQQMQEIVGDQISQEQKKTNQMLALTSANLALAGISLFYPPLLWLVVPIEIYSAIPLYQLAYQSLFCEKRVSSYLLDTMLITGIFLQRYFYLYGITIWFFTVGRKVMLESENNSKKSLTNLFGVPPRSVYVQTSDGVEVEMPFEQVQRGDVVMVSAGQTICVDGV
jgi:Cu2+-exporting ATPase